MDTKGSVYRLRTEVVFVSGGRVLFTKGNEVNETVGQG